SAESNPAPAVSAARDTAKPPCRSPCGSIQVVEPYRSSLPRGMGVSPMRATDGIGVPPMLCTHHGRDARATLLLIHNPNHIPPHRRLLIAHKLARRLAIAVHHHHA